MTEWANKTFSDFASLQKGISYKSEDYARDENGAIFLTIKCVSKAGGFKSDGIKYYAGHYSPIDLLQTNDVLIANTDLTRDGDIVGCPIRVPNIDGNAALMSMDLSKVCIDQSQICPTFLYYLLMTHDVRKYMKDHASGSTVLHLQTSAISKLKLNIPILLKDQNEIAKILETLDKAIVQTESLIAKQQRIKTGMMQDLLTKGMDENGQVRSEKTHRFKESPLGRIPIEWRIEPIKDLAEKITSGSRGWAKYYSEEGAKFIRIGNLAREHINLRLDDIIFVAPPRGAEGSRTKVEAGDILISITADLGIIGVIAKEFGEAYINQHIALMRLNSRGVSARWAGHYMQSHAFQQQVDKANESGAKAGLNLPTISRFLLAFPKSTEEQKAIVDRLDLIDQNILLCSTEHSKLIGLRRGLMHDLLTGRVRLLITSEENKQVVGAVA